MLRLNWPSSGVQVFMVKDFAVHCNTVIFPPILVASGYFGYVGCTWLLLVLFGLLVVAALNVLAGAESLTITTCIPEDGQLGRNM
jgi:hypothetical protein